MVEYNLLSPVRSGCPLAGATPSHPAAPVTLTGRVRPPETRRNYLRLLPESPATIYGFSPFASIYPTAGCAVARGTLLAFVAPPFSFGAVQKSHAGFRAKRKGTGS